MDFVKAGKMNKCESINSRIGIMYSDCAFNIRKGRSDKTMSTIGVTFFPKVLLSGVVGGSDMTCSVLGTGLLRFCLVCSPAEIQLDSFSFVVELDFGYGCIIVFA